MSDLRGRSSLSLFAICMQRLLVSFEGVNFKDFCGAMAAFSSRASAEKKLRCEQQGRPFAFGCRHYSCIKTSASCTLPFRNHREEHVVAR